MLQFWSEKLKGEPIYSMVVGSRSMKRVFLLSLIALAGCGGDWKAKAVDDAEALVRQQVGDPRLRFAHVQVTGDSRSGQACGYYQRPNVLGGTDGVRFIYFVDGADGQNPYIDDPSAPYPKNKDAFELNWREQCVNLGYKADL